MPSYGTSIVSGPKAYRMIRGGEILDLESRYFQTARGRLPYYKITRIECAGEVVFDRSHGKG